MENNIGGASNVKCYYIREWRRGWKCRHWIVEGSVERVREDRIEMRVERGCVKEVRLGGEDGNMCIGNAYDSLKKLKKGMRIELGVYGDEVMVKEIDEGKWAWLMEDSDGKVELFLA